MKPRNGGPAGDSKDLVNLLDDSSDSDVEWLSLPPIKGKKPRKKKSVRSGDGLCSMWTYMKIVLVLLLAASVVILAVSTFWLSQQLRDLRDRMKQVEGRNGESIEEIHKLHGQIMDVNKTVQGFRTGTNSVEQIVKNITAVNTKLAQLDTRVSTLNEDLKDAHELTEIPAKLQAVSKSVAALGSQVTGMTDKVESMSQFMKNTPGQIQELTNKVTQLEVTKATTTPNLDHDPETANLLQRYESLPQELQIMNTSLLTQISLIQSDLVEHEAMYRQLETITEALTRNVSILMAQGASSVPQLPPVTEGISPQDLNKTVTNMVLGIVSRLNLSQVGTSGDVSLDRETMDRLLANIDNVTDAVSALKEQYREMTTGSKMADNSSEVDEDLDPVIRMSMFRQLADGLADKITTLNASLSKTKGDVSALSTVFSKQQNTLVNLTAEISGVKQFLAGKVTNRTEEHETGTPAGQKTTVSGAKATTTTMTNMEGKSTTTPPSTTSLSTERAAGSTSTVGSTTTVERTDIIHIPSIKNEKDLELNFNRWDYDGDRKVEAELLPDYLGPNAPSEEDLEKFDLDHDGVYSLDEFKVALGFKPMPTEKPFPDEEEISR